MFSWMNFIHLGQNKSVCSVCFVAGIFLMKNILFVRHTHNWTLNAAKSFP